MCASVCEREAHWRVDPYSSVHFRVFSTVCSEHGREGPPLDPPGGGVWEGGEEERGKAGGKEGGMREGGREGGRPGRREVREEGGKEGGKEGGREGGVL